MDRIRRCATALAVVILTAITLYSAYFTSHFRIGNEHVLLSRAAAHVPFSRPVGEAVICAYARYWNVDCNGQERAASLGLSIRYLCPVFHETQHFECIDRNMVGISAILTAMAAAIAAIQPCINRGDRRIDQQAFRQSCATADVRRQACCCSGI